LKIYISFLSNLVCNLRPKLIHNIDPRLDPDQKDNLYSVLVKHVNQLVHDRDVFAHHIVEMRLTNATTAADAVSASRDASKITPERNHLALEISEYKAKVRKLNQQL
jgi:hypothetical protein